MSFEMNDLLDLLRRGDVQMSDILDLLRGRKKPNGPSGIYSTGISGFDEQRRRRPEINQQIKDLGVQEAFIVGPRRWRPGPAPAWNDPVRLAWEQDWIDEWLETKLMARDSSRGQHAPVLCVDWEDLAATLVALGPDIDTWPSWATRGGLTLKMRERAIDLMTSLLVYIQQRVPGIFVGYYGYPMIHFYEEDPAAEAARWLSASSIWYASTCFFPSVYDFRRGYQLDVERFGRSVAFVLAVAKGKPVLPYTGIVYSAHAPSGTAFTPIPDEEMRAQLSGLLGVDVGGDLIDGFVEWYDHALHYYYRAAFARDERGDWRNAGDRWEKIRVGFVKTIGPAFDPHWPMADQTPLHEFLDDLAIHGYEVMIDVWRNHGPIIPPPGVPTEPVKYEAGRVVPGEMTSLG